MVSERIGFNVPEVPEKFDGCERQLRTDLSLECVAVYDGNSAAPTRGTCYVLGRYSQEASISQ